MFISLQILLLKLNAVLVQASIISVFIVHFLNVVLITLFLYIRFKITLMVLFKGTLVTSDVTLCHWVYIALILWVVSNKSFNSHMHEIFSQRYCMKWVPGDPLKEMIN